MIFLRWARSTFIWFLLSGKLHKDGDCRNNDEVKDGEFVHLLANTGLPALLKAKTSHFMAKMGLFNEQ